MIGFISGIISGIITGMGVGGGIALIMILSYFISSSQISLQSMNLIYYMPVAFFSLLIYGKQKKINYRAAFRIILFGIGPAAIFSRLANNMDVNILKKLFAVYLIVMGISVIYSTANRNAHK